MYRVIRLLLHLSRDTGPSERFKSWLGHNLPLPSGYDRITVRSHPFPYRALVRSLELRVVSTPIAQRPVANKGHAAYVPPGLGKTYGREDFGLPGWI